MLNSYNYGNLVFSLSLLSWHAHTGYLMWTNLTTYDSKVVEAYNSLETGFTQASYWQLACYKPTTSWFQALWKSSGTLCLQVDGF